MDAFYLMASHPEVQDELYKEIQRVCGGNDPQYSNLPEFHYALGIIYETIRLCPFAGYTPHLSLPNQKLIGKYEIPNGAIINLDMVNLNRNEKYWGENANEFVPSRFLDDTMKFKHPRSGTFVGFSDGPRVCLGKFSHGNNNLIG
jgi:cytochrome P450